MGSEQEGFQSNPSNLSSGQAFQGQVGYETPFQQQMVFILRADGGVSPIFRGYIRNFTH